MLMAMSVTACGARKKLRVVVDFYKKQNALFPPYCLRPRSPLLLATPNPHLL
jgi:hypothetical protein